MDLTRANFHPMIYYDFRRELTQKQCIDQLTSTFGDEAPSKATVYHWFIEFNRGWSMLTDEFKEGRPKLVIVPQSINAVRELIIQDHHVTYGEIKASLGIIKSPTLTKSPLHTSYPTKPPESKIQVNYLLTKTATAYSDMHSARVRARADNAPIRIRAIPLPSARAPAPIGSRLALHHTSGIESCTEIENGVEIQNYEIRIKSLSGIEIRNSTEPKSKSGDETGIDNQIDQYEMKKRIVFPRGRSREMNTIIVYVYTTTK
ncbi:hypothetical protein EVAR_19253_1 [Eumeta japonica]|uniref:Mos1 transposase HTH domain-containing protein n=1 Tax=Eumeta variegata TaxID=151549 RepID=A0A4C1UDF1_EUMVA|nr:hypothetical protein EVAR_19253_1 [Eumeta japonica]